jgi:nucleotide-binding universal stress UspA family protein
LYKRVLVAYDGTREGRTALREGVLISRLFGAEIFVLAVIVETPGIRMAEGAHAGVMAHQDDSYRTILDEAIGALRNHGVEVKGKLVRGEPAPTIGAYAREIKADLVVVGHRKQSLLQRWWLGPSGAYVSDFMDCSILIARNVISDEMLQAALALNRAREEAPAAGG